MDADQNNLNNRVQSHQNQDPMSQLPPLFRNLPGLDELREAIEELQREEMEAAFEAGDEAQAPDDVHVASITNGFPPPPSPLPPPSPPSWAAEGGNEGFHPNAANDGSHSARAASTNNGHLPPPQNHAAEGDLIIDFSTGGDSDADDAPLSP